VSGVALAAEAAPREITKCTTIDKPGSYVLTRNLTTAAGDCVLVAASFVSLDLDGFVITGPGGELPDGAGVISGGTQNFITVRNGAIHNFGVGVGLGSQAVVEKLRVLVV
jgi:hypothetical protein